MFFTPTHYGKKVDDFNEKEKQLILVDTIMTTIFIKSKESKIDKIEELVMSSLSKKRVKIVCDILGWEEPNNDYEKIDFLEKMETTKYSYKKFLKDMDMNIKKHDEEEMKCMLN